MRSVDLGDRRVYLSATARGWVVKVYRLFGTHGSSLAYSRYFYGPKAHDQAERIFEQEAAS